jgi:hypothetical protein
MQDLPQESISPKNLSLEDSQEMLAESTVNIPYIKKQQEDNDIPRLISQKKRKKKNENFITKYFNLLTEKINSSTIKNKIFIIIALIIIIITFFIKLVLYFIMIISLIKKFNKLHTFIFTRILDDVKYKYFINLINYLFLFIGFIIYFVEIFCQFRIRFKTLLTINECSFKSLILSKCLFFVSLGLVPEVIFANIPFKSKKNIFLSFFKMKFLIQPTILIVSIIYTLLILCIRSEKNKKERIINEIKLIKKTVNDFVDKYIFVWNEFDEKITNEEKEKIKEKDKSNKNQENIINDKEEDNEKNNKINDFKRRRTMADLKSNQSNFGPVIKRKRKGSQDKNENKSKFSKLLGNNDEKEEDDDEEKEKNIFLQKYLDVKNKVNLFFSDGLLTKIKKYIILGIVGFIIFSPVINGIFGYGYYIFYDSKATLYFQIDLALCFVFGFTLILLTND